MTPETHGGWGLFDPPEDYVGDQIPTNILSQVSRHSQCWFPTNSQPLGLSVYRGREPFIEFKVQIPKASVPEFLQKSPFKCSQLSSNNRYVMNNGVKWWHPNTVRHFQSGEMDISASTGLSLLISLDGSRNAIIYMRIWTR